MNRTFRNNAHSPILRIPAYFSASTHFVTPKEIVAMERIPCVVIGAGAVGLAVGRALCQSGVSTMVLESNSIFGAGNSSRNSEVLHAGLYYPPGSAKAIMCNEGKHKMLSYLKYRGIPYSQCGKLVIASSTEEIPTLQKIFKNATQSGLKELKLLSAKEVHDMEPAVSCVAAMLSPFTGILDSHNLMSSYVVDIEEAGSDVVYNCAVQSVTRNSEGFVVHTSQGTVQCDSLVNSAGLFAPHLASCMDFYPHQAIPKTYYAKGNYFKLQDLPRKDVPFKRLIYPIPQAGGLGVHATLDLEGNVKFGPNVEWLACPNDLSFVGDRYRFPAGHLPPTDFTVSLNTVSTNALTGEVTTAATADLFYQEIARYWPGVKRDMLVPDYAGIRPKLCGPSGIGNTSADAGSNSNNTIEGYEMPASADFAILGSAAHGVKGLVCLFGIESPGLTSSLAIADHVRDLLQNDTI